MDRCRVLLPPFALLLALAGGAFAGGPDAKPIETFTAFAAEAGAGRKAAVRIEVQRWSTEEEHERLLAALRESGPEKLLDALREIRGPVGRIWTPTSLSYDLSYARSNPAPGGGRRVILAADRPVSFLEMRNPSRRIRSNFTLIEIHLDRNGKGEGKLVPAAGVSHKGTPKIEIADYDALPVDLRDVTSNATGGDELPVLAVPITVAVVPVTVAVVFPLELAFVIALVASPLAARANIVADDHRLGGPVAGLVDVSPLTANVSRRNPVGLRFRRTVPAAGNPIPPPATPVPEAADPNIVRPRAMRPSFMSDRGRPARRDLHVESRKRRDGNLR